MWAFIFVLAIIPMVFYWSDSVREMFPALNTYLPEKSSSQFIGAEPPVATAPDADPTQGEPYKWSESFSEKGYVAWTLSLDRQYRLAVGCRPQANAVLQVTHISGGALERELQLNFQYGQLALDRGYIAGADLIGTVAQFDSLYLQTPATEVRAQFTVKAAESGLIARALQQNCPVIAE